MAIFAKFLRFFLFFFPDPIKKSSYPFVSVFSALCNSFRLLRLTDLLASFPAAAFWRRAGILTTLQRSNHLFLSVLTPPVNTTTRSMFVCLFACFTQLLSCLPACPLRSLHSRFSSPASLSHAHTHSRIHNARARGHYTHTHKVHAKARAYKNKQQKNITATNIQNE